MRPVLIFGTGRCGSTHIQRLISLGTTTWIWGEHGGALTPFLDGVRKYEQHKSLQNFVFGFRRSDDELVEIMRQEPSPHLPWLNQLERQTFRQEVAALIDRIFRKGLPGGWTDWGFKEILYGGDNNSAEMLLQIFPEALAVFTFRAPRATLSSMLANWSPELCKDESRFKELDAMIKFRMDRYAMTLNYFLDFSARMPERITFVSVEMFNWEPSALFKVLRLETRLRDSNVEAKVLGRTNRGLSEEFSWLASRLDEVPDESWGRVEQLYMRCLDACPKNPAG